MRAAAMVVAVMVEAGAVMAGAAAGVVESDSALAELIPCLNGDDTSAFLGLRPRPD